MDPVQGGSTLLKEEIVGFAITGKMNSMSLLLQVMTEVETPGGVSESLTADNKKDLHGITCLKAYVPLNNEISGNFCVFFLMVRLRCLRLLQG
jgi:hypothetical protein